MARRYFDEAAAAKAVAFINHLTHTKGQWAGQAFNLRPWQEKIIRDIFGWQRADGTRQYRTVYIELPRKNGKSEVAAAIAMKLLFADQEAGAEVYGAAGSRDQAGIVFAVAAQMVRNDKVLSRRTKVIDSTKRIVNAPSFYRAIPAEADLQQGFNAHGVVFDELHVQPNRDLWDALAMSMGARAQPMMIAITTAGYDRESICYELHDYADRVRRGIVKDDSFYPVIYAAPEEADWLSEKVWRAANPALGDFLALDFVQGEARKAREMPAYQNSFRRFFLNQWTQQSARWIDMKLWDEQAGPVLTEDALAGRACYGGLDLAAVSDMTAWVMVFPRNDDPERLDVLARFWCPESKLRDSSNRYRDQYRVWRDQGWLAITPGNATDYAFVKAQILQDAQRFRLIDMNVDRLFQAHQLAMELAEEGLAVVGMGQGFYSMAAPMNELERRLLARKIHHGGNSVLRWMADNVAVKTDPAGNLKPDKASSQGKIDGIIGLLMGLDRAMRHEEATVKWAML